MVVEVIVGVASETAPPWSVRVTSSRCRPGSNPPSVSNVSLPHRSLHWPSDHHGDCECIHVHEV